MLYFYFLKVQVYSAVGNRLDPCHLDQEMYLFLGGMATTCTCTLYLRTMQYQCHRHRFEFSKQKWNP